MEDDMMKDRHQLKEMYPRFATIDMSPADFHPSGDVEGMFKYVTNASREALLCQTVCYRRDFESLAIARDLAHYPMVLGNPKKRFLRQLFKTPLEYQILMQCLVKGVVHLSLYDGKEWSIFHPHDNESTQNQLAG